MARDDFDHAPHVQPIRLPALFDRIAGVIEYYTIRKGSGALALASDEPILVEIHVMQAIFGIRADHRKTREIPVELDLRALHGARDVYIGRRIGDEREKRRRGIAQIEAR